MRFRRLPCVLAVAAVLAASSDLWAGENLLANPGFESLSGSLPANWSLYVEPHPGAEAQLAPGVDGGHSAMLHNPAPYQREPVNNWSQNIGAPLAGAKVRLSGKIRTQEATEAALWIQCWARPWRLLHMSTTNAGTPVSGTRDWTTVSVDVEIPEETEAVVVRCVLLGQGLAWFDDLAIEKIADAPAAASTAPARAQTEPSADDGGILAVPGPPSTSDLAEANLLLATTVQELRQANQALSEQVRAMGKELESIRGQVEAFATAPREAPKSSPSPPLVPHDTTPQENPR